MRFESTLVNKTYRDGLTLFASLNFKTRGRFFLLHNVVPYMRPLFNTREGLGSKLSSIFCRRSGWL